MREVTPEDDADMEAFPINEEADLKSVGAKGPFGEKVQISKFYFEVGRKTSHVERQGEEAPPAR